MKGLPEMKTRKTLSIVTAFFLLIALAVQFPIISMADNINNVLGFPESVISGTTENEDAHILSEDTTLRDEYTKHFVLSDGSMLAASYSVPVHYYEDDEWKGIDNTLVSENAKTGSDIRGFVNTESGVKYKFARSSEEAALLEMTADGYSVSWELVANKNTVAASVTNPEEQNGNSDDDILNGNKNISSVKYTNILNDTDIEYILRGNDVKENITVKAAKDSYTYSFRIRVNGAALVLKEDGSIDVVKGDETVKTIPTAFMTDAAGAYSVDVETTLVSESDGVYMLTVTADKTWVDSAQFPVTIDPQLNDTDTVKYTVTKTQLTQNGGENLGDGVVWAGHSAATDKKARFHVSVPINYMVGFDDYIISAKINLVRNSASDGKGNVVIGAYAATTYFNKNNAHYDSVGMSNVSSDKVLINNSDTENTAYGVDITSIVRMWMRNESENKGLVIDADNVGSADAYAAFDAAAGDVVPACVIRYRSAHGLANGFSFHSINLGNGGTAYINDATGNLVVVRDDIICLLKGKATNISGVYNSIMPAYFSGTDDFYGTQMKSGNGWKLNIQEKITGLEAAGNKTYTRGEKLYSYVDATGAKRYFAFVSRDSNTHEVTMKDTDGLGLMLEYSSLFEDDIFYKITDKYGNTKYFDSYGYIVRDEEIYGTRITFEYTGTQYLRRCISRLTDTYRSINLTYNNDRTVKSVTDRFGNIKNYTYDANGNLTGVSDSKGTLVTYAYSGTNLVSVVDEQNNIKVTFSYSGSRIVGAEVFDTSSDTEFKTQSASFSYEDGHSVISHIDREKEADGQVKETASEILNFFDERGRLSAKVEDGEVTAYTYDDNSEFFNNIKTATSVDALGYNLIKDLDNNAYDFAEYGTNAGGSVAVNSSFAYTGAASLSVTSAALTDIYGYAKTFTAPESGTYTFRAFVKPTALTVSDSEDGGAALKLINNTTSASAMSEFVKTPTEAANNNGWSLVSVSIECAAGDSVTLVAGIENATGTALFDGLNFDKGEARSVNLLSNNGFENGLDGWTLAGFVADNSAKTGTKSIISSENTSSSSSAFTTAYIGLSAERSFTLSGWVKGNTVKNNGTAFTGLKAKVYYTVTENGVSEQKTAEYTVSSSAYSDGWQFVSTTFVPPQAENGQTVTVDRIDVYAISENNLYRVWFDDISLVMNAAECYEYNENGDILVEDDFLGNKTNYNYGADGRLSATATEYTQTTYAYDDEAKTTTETVTEYDAPNTDENRTAKTVSVTKKDRYDNTLLSTVSYTEGSLYTYSEYTYDETYNYVISETDGIGNTKSYTYDAHGNKSSETDSLGNVTRYEYDAAGNLLRMYKDLNKDGIFNSGDKAVDYAYTEQGNISSIQANGQAYSYQYSTTDAEKIAKLLFGDTEAVSYEYTEGKISKITYANNDAIEYSYNSLDKIEKIKYNKDSYLNQYNYTYNDDGTLDNVWITGMNAGYFYTYDNEQNLILTEFKYFDSSNYQNPYKTLLTIREENNQNNAIGVGYEFNSAKLDYRITSSDNSVTVRLNNSLNENNPAGIFSKTKTSDILGRITSEIITDMESNGNLSATYEYVSGTQTDANGNKATSDKVKKIVYSDKSEIAYTYDSAGNILTESRKAAYSSNPLSLSEDYSYDNLRRLVRHNSVSQNKTIVYTYDGNGDILSKQEYAYTTGTLPTEPTSAILYGYSDTNWKDKMTSYNGEEITYDESGNPLSYRDGISFTWLGDRLYAYNENSQRVSRYIYNEDGQRVLKNFHGIETRFLLDGSSIVAQEVTNGTSLDYISFFYDESGSPIGMNYLGNNYYYKKNLQGDIIEIWGTEDGSSNHSLRKLVSYTYDAWGKMVMMTDLTQTWFKVGTANPFRYRGYYYDNESGLYYVNGRYYDPEVGRWLNAYNIMSDEYFTNWYNLFAYASNNPVNITEAIYSWSSLSKIVDKTFFNALEDSLLPIRYDVPLYDQTIYSLCWAFCQVMVEDFQSKTVRTNDEATERAIEISKQVNGNIFWDAGGWPTNCKKYSIGNMPIFEKNIKSIFDLYRAVKSGGPLYAYYRGKNSAHLVVVTGVDCVQGIVYTNNPWGIAGKQTFTQFLQGFTGIGSGFFPLAGYILVAERA